MKQRKKIHYGLRITEDQSAKLTELADRAGLNTSDIVRLFLDKVQDVQPGGGFIVFQADQQREVQG